MLKLELRIRSHSEVEEEEASLILPVLRLFTLKPKMLDLLHFFLINRPHHHQSSATTTRTRNFFPYCLQSLLCSSPLPPGVSPLVIWCQVAQKEELTFVKITGFYLLSELEKFSLKN